MSEIKVDIVNCIRQNTRQIRTTLNVRDRDREPRNIELDEEGVTEIDQACAMLEWLVECLDVFPQCIEVWRFLRNTRERHGACLPFSGVTDCVGEMEDWPLDVKMFRIKWLALGKKLSKRYKEGKQPRLHRHEQENLTKGEYVERLPFSFRVKETPDDQ